MAWNTGFQVWLTESQSMENAQMIVNDLYVEGKDWTKESLSAMIGNMRHESSVNPNMYEYGYAWEDDRGYGLVQWTPRSKYWDWAVSAGLDPEKPESQLARIDYETKNNIQWIPRSDYESMTFTQFRTNSGTWSVDYLTEAFTWGYERPLESAGLESMPERKAFANKVFNELDWTKGGGTTDPETPTETTVDFEKAINEAVAIVEAGKTSLSDGFSIDTGGLSDALKNGLKEVYNPPLSLFSQDMYNNTYFKITKLYTNMMKIKPNVGLDELINTIIESALNEISVTLDIEGVFTKMVADIRAIDIPTGGGGTEPEPSDEMFFPVDFTAQGINFWVPPDQPNMDYGGERTGRLHWAYDIGTLGNANVSCHAVRSGEVMSIDVGLGTVVIKHSSDTYYTQYMHLQVPSISVNVGDVVTAGQKIGLVGGTGGYEIHLHFAVSINGTFATQEDTISPREYLKITANNVTGLPNPVG